MVPAVISGVTFTADPFNMDLNTSVIEYTPGVGDKLVSGEVDPEASYEVNNATGAFKPTLPTQDLDLAEVHRQCKTIGELFGKPMDIEWAIDLNHNVWILQARPLTTGGRKWACPELTGRPVVGGRVEGKAVWANQNEALDIKFDEGNILFAIMTSPHMVPLMVKASGIATQVGGRTCHAAIVSRELNKPCIVSVGNLSLVASGTQVVLDANKGTVVV
jgi:pyruvate,water dikinase